MDPTKTPKVHEALLLPEVQKFLKNKGIKALLVRSTDRYFNEYVPKDLSARVRFTGFDGSVGDAIITDNDAHLFVDGRYSLQAKEQALGFKVHVTDLKQSIEDFWLNTLGHLLQKNDVLAFDPRTIDLRLYTRLAQAANAVQTKLNPDGAKFIDELCAKSSRLCEKREAFLVPKSIAGTSVEQKLKLLTAELDQIDVDAILVVKLDDIAWLSNLRCYYFPFQSAIVGIAALFRDRLLLGLNEAIQIGPDSLAPQIEIVKEADFFGSLTAHLKQNHQSLGIDPSECSKAHELALQMASIRLKEIRNPIAQMKAIKNESERLHLRSAFKKADEVVNKTQDFVVQSFVKQEEISEGDVDLHIRNGFKESGSVELSFRPICASGKNGAIIHYGHPDHQQKIQKGSLFLLDTGAYYEGGYATDLTRTFLADIPDAKAHASQKEMFTLVLKASIAGLSARIRKGSLGLALDAIVRAPLWQRGLDFAHGTGHGVGINVHEFPPRIGPTSTTELIEHEVFSIEPGLYFEGLGGVRIENLATIVRDPDDDRFVRVLPLTFCPLDQRLIDYTLLDNHEKNFLAYCDEEWRSPSPWPKLPPLPSAKF